MAVSEPQGVICISGPTAAGKTALAMALYDTLDCEIVSVDSALVYTGMDIGTAKPTPEEQERYPHHLIDICDPAQAYSANHFRRDALHCIDEIFKRGKTPLLVGGTMLYYKALLGGLSELPGADEAVREKIQKRADRHGWAVLHNELGDIDPVAAKRIHPNDPQRLMRALEVYELTGKSLTELTKSQRPGLNYPTWQIAVAPEDRKVLHERIEKRFDLMLEQGFEQEVRGLYERGDLHADLPSMRSVGYRQMWQYFEGELSWDEMRERGVIATRQLAKRQITWLRSWPGLHWLHPSPDMDSAEQQRNLLNSALKILEKPALNPQVWV